MKKTLALTAAAGLAAALSGAAWADNHAMQEPDLIPLGTSAQTETYDGPNTTTAPGQPAPLETDARTNSPGDGYNPATRSDYPFCSEEVRDNCRQRRDPGYRPE